MSEFNSTIEALAFSFPFENDAHETSIAMPSLEINKKLHDTITQQANGQ